VWYVYFLQLGNGDIYVGSTNDLKRRFRSHELGQVPSTRPNLPATLKSYIGIEAGLRHTPLFATSTATPILRKHFSVSDPDSYSSSLEGDPTADKAYAWSSCSPPLEGSTKHRFFVVLHAAPVQSAGDAVRAAIVAEHRNRSTPTGRVPTGRLKSPFQMGKKIYPSSPVEKLI
jgi:hypothetical protein